MMELVLASTSRYRRELLTRLGLEFRCRAPAVDEEALRDPGWSPRRTAEELARAKALSLNELESRAIVLGSDQVAACEGRILGKPGTHERAVEQLEFLTGRTHELFTAVCLWHQGEVWQHTDVTRLTMRPWSRSALERYVAADQPLDCAGAYKLEQRGICLFSAIDTADSTAITGLPLLALTTRLLELGFPVLGEPGPGD